MGSRKSPTASVEALESRAALSGWTPRVLAVSQVQTKEDVSAPVHIRVLDAPNKRLTVNISTSYGLLSTKDNASPSALKVIAGTTRQVNKALSSLSYRPPHDSDAPETITVTANNGSKSASRKIEVRIKPVNDAPEVTPRDTEIERDGSLRWDGQTFWDVDSTSLTVTLTPDRGIIRISDHRATTKNVSATIRGDYDALNRLLQTPGKIRISGNDGKDAKITIRASDGQFATERTVTAFAKESLGNNARAAVESRTLGKDPAVAKPIFSVADHARAIYARNEKCWAADLDLTPISPWNDCAGIFMAGTLVSPRHVVYATHFAMPIGTKIRFVTKDNHVVERTIVKAISPKYASIYFPDITVGALDSDVPESIGFAKVLPDDWTSHMEQRPDMPCLALDQEEKALVTSLQYLNDYAAFNTPSQQPSRSFYEDIVWGDSGNPAFMIAGNQLVLITVWTFGGGGGGTSIASQKSQINEMMRELGGGYQLTEIDLTAFRKVR